MSMALINRGNKETEAPEARHSADVSRDVNRSSSTLVSKTIEDKKWAGSERKNIKVAPPVLDLIKTMCNMTDKDKPESKAYGLVSTAVEEYLKNHFTEREQEIIRNSIEIKYR